MNPSDVRDLHKEEGAIRLLGMIQRATTEAFNRQGTLPLSAFFLAQRDPGGEWYGDRPQVKALTPNDPRVLLDPDLFSGCVAQAAKESMALGVIQAFESMVVETTAGPTASNELNDLFECEFSEVTEGEPHTESKAVLVLSFEHLAFKPMVRLWAAPINWDGSRRTLGNWTEATGKELASSPRTSHLTFYD